jgi:tripartite-type tricarboxylate transporter receptor subunit TctC
MKRSAILFAAIVLLICITGPVWGQASYPTRPIQAYIGFPAGGPGDVIGRGILPILQEKIGQGIGFSNVPGASGATAAAATLSKPADGYALFFGTETMSLWQTMGTADMSALKDFVCIKLVSQAYPVLAVPPTSKFNTAQEFIAYAKAHPKELRIATAGPGTVPHISGLLLTRELGTEFTFVPFQGGGPAVTATMGGQVDATIEMVQSMVSAHQGGKIKILASMTNQPIKGLDIPALGMIETKLAPYLPYGPYFGLFAHKDTPVAIVKILKLGMDEAVEDPRWNEYCKKMYLPQIDLSGQAAVKFLEEWTSKAAWLLYDMDRTVGKNSPSNYGIPRP